MSTATVSRVINNLSYVSDANRERVLAVVNRRAYYPNAHARSLASGRSGLIGLVISDIANPFFPQIVRAVEDEAHRLGYGVLLCNAADDPARCVLIDASGSTEEVAAQIWAVVEARLSSKMG